MAFRLTYSQPMLAVRYFLFFVKSNELGCPTKWTLLQVVLMVQSYIHIRPQLQLVLFVIQIRSRLSLLLREGEVLQ